MEEEADDEYSLEREVKRDLFELTKTLDRFKQVQGELGRVDTDQER